MANYFFKWFGQKIKTVGNESDGHHIATASLEDLIVRGQVAGSVPFNAYGQHAAAGAVTNQVIWPDGAFNLPPAAGVQLTVVSTSAEDDNTPGGTGVRTVDIHYLDANLAEQVETVALNGLTSVTTVATNIRFVQCMHILTAGTNRAAVGTIDATSGGVIYSRISAGSRRCASTARMVPAGKRLLVKGAVAGAASGTAAAVGIIKISSTYFEGHDLTSQSVFVPFGSVAVQDASIPYTFPVPAGPFPAGTVVLMEATTDKGATITGDWFGYLENA